MNIVALIPARGGSKRIPKKNIKLLGGKPLIQWTIEAAQQSGIFSWVIVSTEDYDVAECALHHPGVVALSRSLKSAEDDSADIHWVSEALSSEFLSGFRAPDAFAILRPTAPFRSAETIRDAWQFFQDHQPADSLRAVRFANEPPQKMWVLTLGSRMVPLLPFCQPRQMPDPPIPWHSSPTQTLPEFAVQTAALEIAWTRTVTEQQSISGTSVLSYFMPEREELDINTPQDWDRAEARVHDLKMIAMHKYYDDEYKKSKLADL